MKRLPLTLALVSVLALTWLSSVLQGRWTPSEAVLATAAKLADVPKDVGLWQLQSADALDASALDQLQCIGQLVRSYVHKQTGERVNVFVIMGPTGPTAAHTPEICLPSRNYTISSARELCSLPGPNGARDDFWAVTFKSTAIGGELLHVCYAWSRGDRWVAPADPRFAMAGNPFLYKIQVASAIAAGTGPGPHDACRDFLSEFLPVLGQHVDCLSNP